jgi:sugar O-acyltransferase (sialic acid O-acetyltransferase NeuD family)
MSERIVLLGAGGHAKVILDALGNADIEGLADMDSTRWGRELLGRTIHGGDDWVLKQPATGVRLVNGVGSVDRESLLRRRAVFEKFHGRGYRFAQVIHPAAIISARALLDEGAQVMAGAVIQAEARIGVNTLVNTCASIDHDCDLGAHVHVAPGAVLSGGVIVAHGVHIGAGAVIKQGVRIGEGALIGAGAIVLRDVSPGATIAAPKGETRE